MFITAPKFGRSGLRHGFSAPPFDYGFGRLSNEEVVQRRQELFAADELDLEKSVFMKQIHGRHVAVILQIHRGAGAFLPDTAIPATDALITAERKIPLCVLTADCFPVLIYAPEKPAIAAIHAGWRGIQQNIIGHTLSQMRKNFGVSRFYAAIGPAIRGCCFEVSAELRQQFVDKFGQQILANKPNHIDLAKIVQQQLLAAETLLVEDTSICTRCDVQNWPSYRRDREKSGRFLSYIMLD